MSEKLRVTKRSCLSLFILHSSLFTLFVLAAVVHAGVSERPVVESVHYISAAEYTRVIITLSGEAGRRLFTVPADPVQKLPGRIVIDFAPARRGPQAPLSLPIQDGLLKQVRTGQFSATTVRIVLEVEQLDDYKTFVLESPYRLIVDVKGKVQRQTPSPSKPPSEPVQAQDISAGPPVLSPPPSKPLTEPLPEQGAPPRYRIMLDPGHGGKDPGAMGKGGVVEKDVVLAISQRLGRKLAEREQVEVLFTRTTDVFVPLEERIARANAAKADLFVSIHANASTNSELQGVETYYLNNTNDRATIRLAALENGLRPESISRDDGRAGLSFLLSDLIQNGKEEESIALAYHLQEAVVLRAKQRYSALHSLGVKKGPFYVLVGAHMPCVLVETAFITHPVEGKYLMSSAYQDTLAEGLFLGIVRFLRTGLTTKNL
ncbi:MAG: N-acetylmuramoyl-L-alanine amidase [Deltaproteobacteria bacterium]|nr:N-acetylmuramoyl-L-alanine amidase [Deltaproteobacteria bacterium]